MSYSKGYGIYFEFRGTSEGFQFLGTSNEGNIVILRPFGNANAVYRPLSVWGDDHVSRCEVVTPVSLLSAPLKIPLRQVVHTLLKDQVELWETLSKDTSNLGKANVVYHLEKGGKVDYVTIVHVGFDVVIFREVAHGSILKIPREKWNSGFSLGPVGSKVTHMLLSLRPGLERLLKKETGEYTPPSYPQAHSRGTWAWGDPPSPDKPRAPKLAYRTLHPDCW